MSSQEVDVTITPQQAAHGVILTVTLPTGPARLRIPSATRDGDLVRVRVGAGEVPVRVRVSASPLPAEPAPARPAPAQPVPPSAPTQQVPVQPGGGNPFATSQPGGGNPFATPPAPQRQGGGGKPAAVGCLVAGGLIAAALIGIIAIGSGDDSDSKASGSRTPTYSAGPEPSYSSHSPSYSPSYSPSGVPASPTYRATPEPTEEPEPTEAAAPTPYDKGTCLNGTLPDSTTAQRVDDVEEVPCSASDAHYRVIGSIPMTSDMDRCDAYPKTEYAFSHRYTLNGAVINEYVYCLVGLGSYARG